jgi:adenosine deaminase
MISYSDYLQLLPKTELHCHFTSTMSAELFVRLAAKHGVALPTTDPERLFDYRDLRDFLAAFTIAHDVLRDPEDFHAVALDGVRIGVQSGNLRYREYYLNPQYFSGRGMSYTDVVDPVIEGLEAAQRQWGVGFRLVVAINRADTPESALQLVEQMAEHRHPAVVGLGMDDLTPDGREAPETFANAYALAKAEGFRLTAHVGETDRSEPDAVRIALHDLGVDRIDHGYRIMDDPDLVAEARASGIGFTATPISTTICSGWTLDPAHRIRRMIDAGLAVTVSTDDAMFFRTDIGREYREGLAALGVDAEGAARIALAGIDAAFCDDDEKARLRAQFGAEIAALDALHERD